MTREPVRWHWTEVYDVPLRGAHEMADSERDAVYRDRNLVVQAFAAAMHDAGWHVAWGVDPAEPDWPVLYIETEHGQVSWHIPKAERIYEPTDRTGSFGAMVWDGHTDDEKFARLRAALQPEGSARDGG